MNNTSNTNAHNFNLELGTVYCVAKLHCCGNVATWNKQTPRHTTTCAVPLIQPRSTPQTQGAPPPPRSTLKTKAPPLPPTHNSLPTPASILIWPPSPASTLRWPPSSCLHSPMATLLLPPLSDGHPPLPPLSDGHPPHASILRWPPSPAFTLRWPPSSCLHSPMATLPCLHSPMATLLLPPLSDGHPPLPPLSNGHPPPASTLRWPPSSCLHSPMATLPCLHSLMATLPCLHSLMATLLLPPFSDGHPPPASTLRWPPSSCLHPQMATLLLPPLSDGHPPLPPSSDGHPPPASTLRWPPSPASTLRWLPSSCLHSPMATLPMSYPTGIKGANTGTPPLPSGPNDTSLKHYTLPITISWTRCQTEKGGRKKTTLSPRLWGLLPQSVERKCTSEKGGVGWRWGEVCVCVYMCVCVCVCWTVLHVITVKYHNVVRQSVFQIKLLVRNSLLIF